MQRCEVESENRSLFKKRMQQRLHFSCNFLYGCEEICVTHCGILSLALSLSLFLIKIDFDLN